MTQLRPSIIKEIPYFNVFYHRLFLYFQLHFIANDGNSEILKIKVKSLHQERPKNLPYILGWIPEQIQVHLYHVYLYHRKE